MKLIFKILAGLGAVAIGTGVFYAAGTSFEEPAELAFSDMTEENRLYIETSYRRGIMPSESDELFGADEPIRASEAAYAAIWVYEEKNGRHSYEGYEPNDPGYIKKALEYEIWPQINVSNDNYITRIQGAAIFAQLVDEDAPDVNRRGGFAAGGEFEEQALLLYNKGIAVSDNITEAYSPDAMMTRGETAQIVTMLINPEARRTSYAKDYSELEGKLTELLGGRSGDWSLYFMDYDTGDEISINSHQVYSASLIKLFVIQTVYDRIAAGAMSDSDETENQLSAMITYSDNNAWSKLAKKLGGGSYSRGMALVTQTAADSGFADTGQFYKGAHKNYNFTSVNDCGAYMKAILDGSLVSEEYSGKILNYLKQQQHRHKLPSGVPEGVETANKTGELDYMQGDAAIVFSPASTYILVMIGDDLNGSYGQIPFFGEVSQTVYNFVNEE